MALLPPPYHAPLPVAAVYLLASILHEETNRPEDAPSSEFFRRYPLPSARLSTSTTQRPGTPRTQSFSLVVAAVEPLHDTTPSNPYLFAAVKLRFRDRHGRRFCDAPEQGSMTPEALYQFGTVLKPPFTDCLSPAKIKSTINTGLARAVAPISDELEIRIPDFSHDAIARYRQALAIGVLGAVLVEESGRVTPIPSYWWRSEAAEGAFVESAPVTIDVDGREVTGTPFVDLAALKDGWRPAYGLTPAAMRNLETGFGPYLDFMQAVARELGIVDGCGPDGRRISTEVLKQEISRMWDDRPGLGGRSGTKIEAMTTLLRHPDHGVGGYLHGRDVA